MHENEAKNYRTGSELQLSGYTTGLGGYVCFPPLLDHLAYDKDTNRVVDINSRHFLEVGSFNPQELRVRFRLNSDENTTIYTFDTYYQSLSFEQISDTMAFKLINAYDGAFELKEKRLIRDSESINTFGQFLNRHWLFGGMSKFRERIIVIDLREDWDEMMGDRR